MREDLRRALELEGWNELYEQHIVGLSQPNARGERRARSPFPDVVDRNPSFTVNIFNGLWRCYNSDRAGDYVLFLAIMNATEFDEEGRALVDTQRTERELLREHDLTRPVDPEWVEQCHE